MRLLYAVLILAGLASFESAKENRSCRAMDDPAVEPRGEKPWSVGGGD